MQQQGYHGKQYINYFQFLFCYRHHTHNLSSQEVIFVIVVVLLVSLSHKG